MGETIFMIHGMWGGEWHWDNYKTVFEKEGYRCVSTTLPYHDIGSKDSPDPRLGTTGLLDYASYLEEKVRQQDATPIIMGHSMGGLLAQMLGSRGLAKALVLLTPASPAGILAFTPSVMKSFMSVQATWGFWKKPMRQKFTEAAYSMMHLLPPTEQKEAYAKFVHESGRAAYEIGYWFLDTKKASKVDETKITIPVLVVAGSQDRITPASVVRKVAKKYSAVATYKEFPDHAHWVLGEPGWEEVAECVKDWLPQALAKNA
jgi:pimeloyl-ACP methyl ester carboxylesterase